MPCAHDHLTQLMAYDPVHSHRMDQKRRLSIVRKNQLLHRPLPRDPGEMEAQRVIGFLEYLCGFRKSGSQLPAHTHELGTLSWEAVSYTHLRAHETDSYLVCRLLLEKKKKK